MSNEQNDQMSEFPDIDAALDDDEIVDLLEVVKPGKDSGAKASGADDVDFSADLDAMLEKLESAERALDAQDNAAPFPDPTPVDHTVDPDETLDMPSMDDLNNLLETLGAPADAPEAKEAGGLPNLSADLDAAPIMEQSSSLQEGAEQPAPSLANEMPDLDALLAAADAADGAPAAQAKTSVMDASDLDALLDRATPAQAPAAAPAAPAVGGQPDLDALPAQPAPARPAAAPVVDGQPDLDALLAGAEPAATPKAAPMAGGQPDLDALLAAADDGAEDAPRAVPAETASAADTPEVPMDLDDLPIAAAPAAPVSAPIVDGQPDLDALLAQPAPARPAAAPVVDGQPDLDALLAGAEPASAPKAAPMVGGQPDLDALLGGAEPAPVVDGRPEPDTLPEAANAAPVPEEAPAGEPAAPDIPDMAMDEAVPAAPAAQPRPSDAETLAVVAEAAEDLPLDAGQAQPSTAPRYDEVDLNELDALLDDMLASAPASGPAPTADPAEPARAEASTPSAPQAQDNLAPLQEAVIRMENSIQGLQTELKERDALIENQQAQIAGLQDTLEHMRGNMDKLAAEAAAKVIREELAALLREDG